MINILVNGVVSSLKQSDCYQLLSQLQKAIHLYNIGKLVKTKRLVTTLQSGLDTDELGQLTENVVNAVNALSARVPTDAFWSNIFGEIWRQVNIYWPCGHETSFTQIDDVVEIDHDKTFYLQKVLLGEEDGMSICTECAHEQPHYKDYDYIKSPAGITCVIRGEGTVVFPETNTIKLSNGSQYLIHSVIGFRFNRLYLFRWEGPFMYKELDGYIVEKRSADEWRHAVVAPQIIFLKKI